MSRLLVLLVLSSPALAAAPAIKVQLQMRESNPAEAAPVEKAISDAFKELSSVQLVKSGGTRVLQADMAHLGGGRVLYLQSIEGGKAQQSTTVTLSGESGELSAADKKALRAAIVEVLVPTLHVGRIALKVDVPGAVATIDGIAQSGTSFEAPVGTHALRVTHPAYRDFLRFVEVAYDETLSVDVALSMYPLTEGEMAEKLKKPTSAPKKLPWYRSWWALTLVGVAVTGVTTGIVWGVRPGVSSDRTIIYTVK
jgi:hypothetical protein